MAKLGLALSGGGVAGCAHLGVLQALEEEGINIHCLSGTSSGAFISALYAYGYTTKELIHMVPELSKRFLDVDLRAFLNKLWRPKVKVQGFFKGHHLHSFIAHKTNHSNMEILNKPVAILSVDLKQAKQVAFTSQPFLHPPEGIETITDISIADAVRSSCSIPVLFKPFLYGNRLLVDGGVINNCPLLALKAFGADRLIAVDLVSAEPVESTFDSWSAILSRIVSMNLAYQMKELTKVADIVLQPEARFSGAFDFSKIEHNIDSAYRLTKEKMPDILRLLH